jgi:hypothetical protein
MNSTTLTSKPVPWLFMVQRMAAQMFSAGESFPASWILTGVALHGSTSTWRIEIGLHISFPENK